MFSLNGTLKKSGSVGRWETKQSIGMASALSGSLTPKSYDEHPRHVKYGSPPLLPQNPVVLWQTILKGAEGRVLKNRGRCRRLDLLVTFEFCKLRNPRGWGTPLYKLYGDVPPFGVWFFDCLFINRVSNSKI